LHLYTIDGKRAKKFHDSGRVFLKKVLGDGGKLVVMFVVKAEMLYLAYGNLETIIVKETFKNPVYQV